MRPSATFGSAANVRPGSCSRTLNTVCSETIGRLRIACRPSSTQPIAGPSATPSSRTLPSARNASSSAQRSSARIGSMRVLWSWYRSMWSVPSRRSESSSCARIDSGSPVVRALRLARELARGVDVVAALRGEDDLVAARLEHVGEQRLADSRRAVHRRGVDEVDAGVERGVEQPGLVVDLAPPVAGEGPGAEPDLGDLELGRAEPPVAHGVLLTSSGISRPELRRSTRHGCERCAPLAGTWVPRG